VFRTAAVLLGIGLGGLLDSILLQELLQQHLMLSTLVPLTSIDAMRQNLRWTGVGNAIAWGFATAGAITAYRAARHRMPVPSHRLFFGSFLMGWGGFNLVEGLLTHEIIGAHHMVDGPHRLLADLLYLAIGGAMFIVIGAWLVRPRRDWMAGGRKRRVSLR
jgi:uncharacterized membrane protein